MSPFAASFAAKVADEVQVSQVEAVSAAAATLTAIDYWRITSWPFSTGIWVPGS